MKILSALTLLIFASSASAGNPLCEYDRFEHNNNVSRYLTEYGIEKGVRDFTKVLAEHSEEVKHLEVTYRDLKGTEERYEKVSLRLSANKPQYLEESGMRPLNPEIEVQLKIEKGSLTQQIIVLRKLKEAQIEHLKKLLAKADARIAYGHTNNPGDIHEKSFYLDVPLENGKYFASETGIWFGDCSVKFVVRNRAKIALNMEFGRINAFLYDGSSECAASYPLSVVSVIARDYKAKCQADPKNPSSELPVEFQTLVIRMRSGEPVWSNLYYY